MVKMVSVIWTFNLTNWVKLPFFIWIYFLDPEKIQQVKEIYKALDLPTVYESYKDDSYNRAKSLVYEISNGVQQKLFIKFLNDVYERDS